METLFENFLEYCKEDNIPLTKDIKTWLADYFDLQHRTMQLHEEEIKWIEANLTKELQAEIFGYTLVYYLKNYNHLKEKIK